MDAQLRLLAEKALQVQDACNLSGVIHTWSDVMTALWKIAHEQGQGGTQWVNTHPIAFLFAYKAMALAGYEPLSAPFEQNYEQVLALVQGEVTHAV